MPKLAPMLVKLGVLADYANITREGKLNILGIFDVINAPAFPFALPIFYVVVSYEFSASELKTAKNTEIVLCDEDGKELVRMPQQLHIERPDSKGNILTTNQIAGIVGFPFREPGNFVFDILVNGDLKKSISFRVNDARPKQQ
jgi:hypothetical protein